MLPFSDSGKFSIAPVRHSRRPLHLHRRHPPIDDFGTIYLIVLASARDTSLPEGLLVIANRSKDLEAQVLLLKMRHDVKRRSGLTSL